jgi:hypothetical protein
MRVIDSLNELESKGQLSALYLAGLFAQSAITYRQIYLSFCALRDASPGKNITAIVGYTAENCRVSEKTVWIAKRVMEKLVA